MTQKIYFLRIVAQSIKQSWHSRNRIVPFALKYSQALIMYNTDGETQSRLYDEYMLGTSREDGMSLANEFVPHVIVISFTTLEAKEIRSVVSALRVPGRVFIGVGQGVGRYTGQYEKDILSCFDIVIQGEPELMIKDICVDLGRSLSVDDIKHKYSDQLQREQTCCNLDVCHFLPILVAN